MERADHDRPATLGANALAHLERAKRFVCRAPDGLEKTAVRHSAAHVYFGARQWEEAALLWHDNAMTGTDAVAIRSATSSLECLGEVG